MALDVENSGNNRGKKSIRKNEKRTCIYQYTILELSNAQVLDVAVGSVETLSAFFAV